MKHIDLLIPFALPQPEMAADLLREINAPVLATLAARAKTPSYAAFDPFSRTLPHETWLAGQFGLGNHLAESGSPPIASAAMLARGMCADAGVWFLLQPVHIHIARDHLILTDTRQLTLTEQESHALFDAAKPLFDEAGHELLYGDARTWFVRADDWAKLQTSTPDAACGHNIDIWMPKGAGERAWRKVQNEVQMHWHTHAVNEQRATHGLTPVNSLWLWGGTPTPMRTAPSAMPHVFTSPGWMDALGQLAPTRMDARSAADIIAALPEHGLLAVDTLIEPALAEHWSDWLARIDAIDANWLAPLLEALKSGKIDRIRLILTHNTGLSEFIVSRNSLRKFWVKPSLARLAP